MAKKHRLLDSRRGYDLASGVYDTKEKYLNSFEQGLLLSVIGDVQSKKILDVGAGTGRMTLPMAAAGAEVTALDVSEAMLKVLSRKAKGKTITTVVGEAESLPFPDETFDVVVAAFLVVHLKNPRRFFDEAYRVLKDGGVLIVSNINQKDPPEIKTPEGTIVIESYYHRPEAVRETLEELAFSIEEERFVKENGIWINQILRAKK